MVLAQEVEASWPTIEKEVNARLLDSRGLSALASGSGRSITGLRAAATVAADRGGVISPPGLGLKKSICRNCSAAIFLCLARPMPCSCRVVAAVTSELRLFNLIVAARLFFFFFFLTLPNTRPDPRVILAHSDLKILHETDVFRPAWPHASLVALRWLTED